MVDSPTFRRRLEARNARVATAHPRVEIAISAPSSTSPSTLLHLTTLQFELLRTTLELFLGLGFFILSNPN